MQRITGPDAIAGQFNDNPVVQAPTTRVTAAWLNDIQENVAQAIEGAGIVLSPGDGGQLLAAIRAIAAVLGHSPGDLKMRAAAAVPTGWLECDGAAVSRATYAALYAVIGDTWGAGDGTTTFNLPDFRGEFIRGFDNGRGVDAARVLGAAQAESHPTYALNSSTVSGTWRYDPNDDSSDSYLTLNSSGAAVVPRNQAALILIKT